MLVIPHPLILALDPVDVLSLSRTCRYIHDQLSFLRSHPAFVLNHLALLDKQSRLEGTAWTQLPLFYAVAYLRLRGGVSLQTLNEIRPGFKRLIAYRYQWPVKNKHAWIFSVPPDFFHVPFREEIKAVVERKFKYVCTPPACVITTEREADARKAAEDISDAIPDDWDEFIVMGTKMSKPKGGGVIAPADLTDKDAASLAALFSAALSHPEVDANLDNVLLQALAASVRGTASLLPVLEKRIGGSLFWLNAAIQAHNVDFVEWFVRDLPPAVDDEEKWVERQWAAWVKAAERGGAWNCLDVLIRWQCPRKWWLVGGLQRAVVEIEGVLRIAWDRGHGDVMLRLLEAMSQEEMQAELRKFVEKNGGKACRYVDLTTDELRKAAVALARFTEELREKREGGVQAVDVETMKVVLDNSREALSAVTQFWNGLLQ
ncbi:hypothetical protein HK101_005590 [Irineochytrium annulatum]|nr:hypothetical protein HK101_005590 [Irineochytrium annulatum]